MTDLKFIWFRGTMYSHAEHGNEIIIWVSSYGRRKYTL